jgi:hypothetical protein
MTLTAFERILIHTDWEAKARSADPAKIIGGRTSIAHAADSFLALSDPDQREAQKLLCFYLPNRWKGWPIVLRAAKTSRKAVEQAIKTDVLSDNRQAENYHGHYFYTHSEGGQDFFTDRRTFLSIASPFSKFALVAFADRKIF